MCVAFPGRVVEVDEVGAVVDTEGRLRRVSTLFLPEVAVGDWVAVMADTIVERLEESHALEVQQILREAIALEVAEESGQPGADERPVPGALRVATGTT